jgi:DNA/RNA endonuclease YhcR with UshA esterase domain
MSNRSDKAIEFSMGSVGPEIVTGTGSGTAGPWNAIQFVTAGAFSAITINNGTGTFTGVTFPAGFTLYGEITAFTLSSGTVVANKGKISQ